ncbi:hypothetical protein [Methylosinus sp. PW1]|uniref:hypothetical protein n=1 Tax=Methylosinus sp. PW1 TaxID=107636 RepID=UPI0005644340|nr:hypothetical protein [Methylosinus sp. PW1]
MGLFSKPKPAAPDPRLVQLAEDCNEAEIRHLDLLRREIANILIGVDPDLMVRTYQRAWEHEREVQGNEERLRTDEAALVVKFPRFPDFDLLNVRHFVPYGEAHDHLANDQLVERYLDISRMLIYLRRRAEHSSHHPLFSDEEFTVLRDVVRGVKDATLRRRIQDAMRLYYAYWAGYEYPDRSALGVDLTYRDAEIEVIRLHSLGPDIEYGVIFQETGEFGVYSFFVHDDGRRTQMYARTDQSFNKRQHL